MTKPSQSQVAFIKSMAGWQQWWPPGGDDLPRRLLPYSSSQSPPCRGPCSLTKATSRGGFLCISTTQNVGQAFKNMLSKDFQERSHGKVCQAILDLIEGNGRQVRLVWSRGLETHNIVGKVD